MTDHAANVLSGLVPCADHAAFSDANCPRCAAIDSMNALVAERDDLRDENQRLRAALDALRDKYPRGERRDLPDRRPAHRLLRLLPAADRPVGRVTDHAENVRWALKNRRSLDTFEIRERLADLDALVAERDEALKRWREAEAALVFQGEQAERMENVRAEAAEKERDEALERLAHLEAYSEVGEKWMERAEAAEALLLTLEEARTLVHLARAAATEYTVHDLTAFMAGMAKLERITGERDADR